MKRMIVLTLGVLLAVPLFARAPRPPAHRHQPPRVPHHHHQPPRPHHHHGSAWGKGGRNFWPGFVGGVALGLATRAVAEPTTVVVHRPASTVVVQPAPVVVQPAPVVIQQPVVVKQPVYQTQNVWVEGRYVDVVQPNGTTVRTWQPGHFEQRTVQIQ
jgi:hypothetical protein